MSNKAPKVRRNKAPDVKPRREYLGLSQQELGDLAGGINRGTVAGLEDGTRDTRQGKIDRLREALKMEEARQGRAWTPHNGLVAEVAEEEARPYALGIRLEGGIEIIGRADTEGERTDLAELLFVTLGRFLGRDVVERLQSRFDDKATG